MKIEGFGNRSNHQFSESANQLGTRVTSNSLRKTAGGVTSGDRNVVDSGFHIDVGSQKMGKTATSFPRVN